MSHHKINTFSWSAVALVIFLPLAVTAQEKGYPFRVSNFKFEFYGGYAPIKPDDLNVIADYENLYLQFYYIQRYNAFAPLGFNVSFERTGDAAFRPIKRAAPWGARLKYELSPTFALAVGIQCLSATENSRVGLGAILRDSLDRTYADRYDNPGFVLSLKAWLPQLGAFFGWSLGSAVRYELFIAGGPMFTEIKAVSDVRISLTDWSGASGGSGIVKEIKGKGKSWAGELGTVLRVRPAKFFDLFAEASYAFRQDQDFTGPGKTTTTWTDPVAGETTSEASWDGPWRLVTVTSSQSWGKFSAVTASNVYSWGSGVRKFVLQFSGFQLKGGLSIRL
jgi:hypothetical protein